jgi:hypothetical protein
MGCWVAAASGSRARKIKFKLDELIEVDGVELSGVTSLEPVEGLYVFGAGMMRLNIRVR